MAMELLALSTQRHLVNHDLMEIGEVWAYRARSIDDLVEVQALRIGSAKPARVLVRFEADEFEGREEWVPPARLKVLWTGVEEFRVQERRWAQVSELSPPRDSAEHYASSIVFEALIDDQIATLGYGHDDGVVIVHDLDALTAFLDVDPEELLDSPVAFQTAAGLVVPWPTTEMIARRAATRDPNPILRQVEADEATFQRRAIFGETYPATRGYPEWHIDAKDCAEREDEPYNRPCWNLLREWCGSAAVDRRDELLALREEVARLARVIVDAAGTLRRKGFADDATRIERDLGVPVADVRRA